MDERTKHLRERVRAQQAELRGLEDTPTNEALPETLRALTSEVTDLQKRVTAAGGNDDTVVLSPEEISALSSSHEAAYSRWQRQRRTCAHPYHGH